MLELLFDLCSSGDGRRTNDRQSRRRDCGARDLSPRKKAPRLGPELREESREKVCVCGGEETIQINTQHRIKNRKHTHTHTHTHTHAHAQAYIHKCFDSWERGAIMK